MTFSSARTTVASVAGNAGRAVVAASTSANQKVLIVKSVGLSGSGTIDLANNGMVIDYEKGEPSPAASVRAAHLAESAQ